MANVYLSGSGDAVVIVENEEGEPLSVGRKTRTVPTAIKRALRARDKGCQFPSCGYRAQDRVDNDIDVVSGEISKLFNNPSAEGLAAVVEYSALGSLSG